MDNKLLVDVVMLSTKDKSPFYTGIVPGTEYKLYLNASWEACTTNNQHLYLVSSREIKEGDWFQSIAIDANGIYRSKVDDKYGNGNKMATVASDGRYKFKIEATTDPSLGLPLIPAKWIEEVYVPSQGKIKQVYIEMMQYDAYKSKPHLPKLNFENIKDNNGEVIILPIKDSWNREEVKIIASAYFEYLDDVIIKQIYPAPAMNFDEYFDKNY